MKETQSLTLLYTLTCAGMYFYEPTMMKYLTVSLVYCVAFFGTIIDSHLKNISTSLGHLVNYEEIRRFEEHIK